MGNRSTRMRGRLRGKIWTQRDRFGNDIYLTCERWNHIINPDNHPEVEPYGDHLRETVRLGRRKQDPILPNAYKYYREFDDLPEGMNHLVAVVVFRWVTNPNGAMREEKFMVAVYFIMSEMKYNYCDRPADEVIVDPRVTRLWLL